MTLPALRSELVARRQAFFATWAAVTVFIMLQDTANALSQLHDVPSLGALRPFLLEFTSGAMIVALAPLIVWAVRTFPPRRGRLMSFVAAHAAGSVAFSLVHVAGFTVLRRIFVALAHAHPSRVDWLYEYRKDLVAYLGFGGLAWLIDWAFCLRARSSMAHAALMAASRPPLDGRPYLLKDGARTTRVPQSDIIAVASARNYTEFHLADGRTRLVRGTLAKVEQDLSGGGFLRTHRSWLVNARHVLTVSPAAGGDFRLQLSNGVSAPLSRRFRPALDNLVSLAPSQPVPVP